MLKLIKLLLLTIMLNLGSLFAQSQAITGKVTDSKNGSPLSGASVILRGTGKGTSTAQDGTFRIQAQTGNVLIISMLGYTSTTITIGSQTTDITITLDPADNELTQVVLVGTRTSGRVKLETPVPVDVVNVGQVAMPTARMDLTSIINYAAPSFNYNKQSGSDGADHIDLATLRGLGPDQTLVLINGKRRHQTAFIAVFGTRGRGNSGTDLSAIPIGSIDRVEILRDGASAQYGSDAIAGVINIVLKKSVNQLTGNIGTSAYYDKKYNPYFKKEYGQYVYDKGLDGKAVTANVNYGFPVGSKGGFINLTGSFIASGKTYRQALDTNQNSKDFMYTNIYRRAHGDGSLTSAGAFVNAEIPLSGGGSFYAFSGYNYKFSDAYAFTRNFSARPDRFPTTNAGVLIDVPGIIMTTSDGEKYFNPHIQSQITDFSLATGTKGKMNNGWDWDFSNTVGINNFHFYGNKTFNASKGASQTHFDDGGFNFLQNTVNLNFTKEIPGVGEGFNLAVGAEYRYERYKLFAGEQGSYFNFDPSKTVTNDDGDVLNVAAGSQGFPGYQPNDEVNDANRSTYGAYVDAELDVTSKFLLGGAVRFENYSDFGFTHNYKLAARYKATHNFNLRGSVSTGFRAPSLQQINFSSTFTTVQGGNIAEVKIAPNYSLITKAAGIPELKQEKSVNASLGFTFKPTAELSFTVDGYWVKIKDRVVLSGQFSVDDNTLDPQLIAAMQNLNVSLAQFFANAVNTSNRGIDIVVEYNKKFGLNSFKALFTGNFQKMDIDKINVPAKLNGTADLRATFLNEREQKFILASAPNSKFGLNLEYGIKKFSVGTRLTYFGEVEILGYGDGTADDFTPPFQRGDLYAYVPADADGHAVKDQYIYSGKLVTDLYVTYKLSKNFSLFAGADNIFNVHPDLGTAPGAVGWAFNNETGGPWDAVQMGGNGTRFFARIGFSF